VNVEFWRFHKGRGVRKTDPQGGHIIVNRKKIVNEKGKVTRKEMFWKRSSTFDFLS